MKRAAALRATRVGRLVPTDSFDGRVVMVTSTSVYCRESRSSTSRSRSRSTWTSTTASGPVVAAGNGCVALVIGLHPAEARPAMTAVAVHVVGLCTGTVSPGAPVHVRAGSMRIGGGVGAGVGDWAAGLDVDLSSALQWRQPPRRSIDPIAAAELADRIEDSAEAELAAARDRLGLRFDAVVCAVRGEFPDAAVGGLVGFGPGLTPSGDDALIGLLAALSGELGRDRFDHLADAVYRAAGATTDLSAQGLRLAAGAEFDEAVSGLLACCAGARWPDGASGPERVDHGRVDHGRVDDAVRTLLRCGATSGADILTGLVAGLRMNALAGALR